jgi:hypothetical protein
MQEQFSASGGKAVKLVATDTPQFIAGIGELGHARRFRPGPHISPFPPSRSYGNPPHRSKECSTPPTCHLRTCGSSSEIRAHRVGFASLALPARVLKPRYTEIPLFPKTLSSGIARARARAKSPVLDQPYNPRMLTQESVTRTNPGKTGAKPEPGRANGSRNVRGSSPWPVGGLAAIGRMLGRLSRGFLLASRVQVKGVKRMGTIHRLWPVLSVSRLTHDHRADNAPLYGALSVARRVAGACRNYLAGNRGKPPVNRRSNEMAGESVALNPALRERNRNLKGCGLTGLLFLGWHRPCNP